MLGQLAQFEPNGSGKLGAFHVDERRHEWIGLQTHQANALESALAVRSPSATNYSIEEYVSQRGPCAESGSAHQRA